MGIPQILMTIWIALRIISDIIKEAKEEQATYLMVSGIVGRLLFEAGFVYVLYCGGFYKL